MLNVNDQISIPLREFQFTWSRSGGPGGQNVNKVNSRVQLRWDVERTSSLPPDVRDRFRERYRRQIAKTGELVLTSQRFRDQGRNVADVLNRLAEMIRQVAAPPKVRKPKKVSARQRQRRLDAKHRQSEKKQMRRPLD